MLWPFQHVGAFHNNLCLWGLGGLQENRGYWSNVLRVLQVPARGAKNNQHVHHAGKIWHFEHFAWGQALLYYNRVSTVTKNRILGKAWEAQFAMLPTRKKCWAGSVKKWLLKNQPQESTPGGGRFSAFDSTLVRNGTSACSDPCVLCRDCSIAAGNSSLDNAHTSDPSSKGERLGGEPSTLVQHAQSTGGSSDG
jgi:hypothetical protein